MIKLIFDVGLTKYCLIRNMSETVLADNFKTYSTKQYVKITFIFKRKIQVKQEN